MCQGLRHQRQRRICRSTLRRTRWVCCGELQQSMTAGIISIVLISVNESALTERVTYTFTTRTEESEDDHKTIIASVAMKANPSEPVQHKRSLKCIGCGCCGGNLSVRTPSQSILFCRSRAAQNGILYSTRLTFDSRARPCPPQMSSTILNNNFSNRP